MDEQNKPVETQTEEQQTNEQSEVESKQEFAWAEMNRKLKDEKEKTKTLEQEIAFIKENINLDEKQPPEKSDNELKQLMQLLNNQAKRLERIEQRTSASEGQRISNELINEGYTPDEIETFFRARPDLRNNPEQFKQAFLARPEAIEKKVEKLLQQKLEQIQSGTYVPVNAKPTPVQTKSIDPTEFAKQLIANSSGLKLKK